jgi:amidase
MSLPMGASNTGLPIGMMFTGRYSDEATLYRLAAQIEEARPWQPWADHKPQVWG